MSRKIGRVLSIDIIQHAGAHSRGRIRHNGRRYTLFGAFSGVQSCCADRARSERYSGCPSGTDYAPSAFPRPWGVPGPNIWRNVASGGAIQRRRRRTNVIKTAYTITLQGQRPGPRWVADLMKADVSHDKHTDTSKNRSRSTVSWKHANQTTQHQQAEARKPNCVY